jgi:colanic acid/amylovoran biosynthesis glycosyltransferase
MQLPVIISDAGGMKEGVIDGVTGFVVPENDINGFVEKIELLANDPDLRKRMGEAGRNFVVENYDINKLNEKLMQIYLN